MSNNDSEFSRALNHAQGATAQCIEDMQRAMMDRACKDAGMIVGRAYTHAIPAHSHTLDRSIPYPLPADAASWPVSPAAAPQEDNLPPGEAFTRATVLVMLKRARDEAVQRDRLRLQPDGWTLKGAAARAFLDILGEVMGRQNVPGDAATAIMGECALMMADWE